MLQLVEDDRRGVNQSPEGCCLRVSTISKEHPKVIGRMVIQD